MVGRTIIVHYGKMVLVWDKNMLPEVLMIGGRKNILVVDDDVEFLSVMQMYLKEIGFVQTASSGRRAVQLAQQAHFDVILLDLEMPIMDGPKTLAHLRNLDACINVPVIMITGKNDRNAVMNSLALGIDGYLLKPVSKQQVIETVNAVLEKKSIKGNKKTVVAIDDDMSYLKYINNFLKDDYHVVMINSAKLAISYLTNHTPDLILLDYQIPLFNGVALMRIIQQNSICQRIPFIILSGSLDTEALEEFLPYNPVAILAKPVEKETLLKTIRESINKIRNN